MGDHQDLFLGLSSTAWTGVGSLMTFLAVAVALFLPFFLDRSRTANIVKAIEIETKYNYELLTRADKCGDGDINGHVIPRMNLMVAVLVNLRVDIWENNKTTIAGLSAESFAKNYEINNLIKDIQRQSAEIISNKGNSPWVVVLDGEVKKCISLIESIAPKR